MFRTLCLLFSWFALAAASAGASELQTLDADTLTAWLRSGRAVTVVDLQPPEKYREHHFDGALSAAGDPQAVDRIARRLARSKGEVVVVSPQGGDDAVRAANRLTERGVARSRIRILEKGMEGALGDAPGCACCTFPEEGAK